MPWLFVLQGGFNLGDVHVAETIASAIEFLARIAKTRRHYATSDSGFLHRLPDESRGRIR
jgi:hypothetical protein